MKRTIVFGSIFLILIIGFMGNVRAENSCDADQRILRLYQTDNSHGVSYNYEDGNNYVDICYNELFGSDYSGGDIHACSFDGSNVVLELSNLYSVTGPYQNDPSELALFNAHGQGNGYRASGDNYDSICYGELRCTPRSGSCRDYETAIVKLSDFTNGHLGTSSSGFDKTICCWDESAGGNYPYCGDGTCQPMEANDPWSCVIDGCSYTGDLDACELEDAYWADANGVRLEGDALDLVEGTKVGLVLEGTSDCNGLSVDYQIFEDDWVGDDPIQFDTDPGRVVFVNGRAVRNWNAEWVEDVGVPEYYFRGWLVGDENKVLESEDRISVSQGGDQDDGDIIPNAGIISPEHQGIYFKGSEIEIKSSLPEDEIGDYTFSWEIVEDNKQSSDDSFSYVLDSVGQKTISLKLTKDGQGDYAQIAILVVDGNVDGTYAFVERPKHRQVLPDWNNFDSTSDDNYLVVSYSAKDSYVVDVEGIDVGACTGSIECLGGDCPEKTSDPSCEIDGKNQIDLGGDSNRGDYSKLEYGWKFFNGDTQINSIKIDGKTGGIQNFGNRGDKRIELSLKYDEGDFDLSRVFTRIFALGQCKSQGNVFVELDPSSGEELVSYDTLNSGYCAGSDGIQGSIDDCCPTGFICGATGCYQDDNTPEKCSDYTSESSCNEAPQSIAKLDDLWDDECESGVDAYGNSVTCSCTWDSEAGDDGECQFDKTSVRTESDGSGGSGGDSLCQLYNCQFNYTESECVGKRKTIDVKVNFSPGTCLEGVDESICGQEGSRTIACGLSRQSIELGFFGMSELALAFVTIMLIYFVIGIKRR